MKINYLFLAFAVFLIAGIVTAVLTAMQWKTLVCHERLLVVSFFGMVVTAVIIKHRN